MTDTPTTRSITITLPHDEYKKLTMRAVDSFVSRKKWVERVVKEALKSQLPFGGKGKA